MLPGKFVRSMSGGNKNRYLEADMAQKMKSSVTTLNCLTILYISRHNLCTNWGTVRIRKSNLVYQRRIQNRKLKFSQTMTFLLTTNPLIIVNLQCRCMQFQKRVTYERLRSVLEMFMRRCVNQTQALRKFWYENIMKMVFWKLNKTLLQQSNRTPMTKMN